jgi:hypothetical protein
MALMPPFNMPSFMLKWSPIFFSQGFQSLATKYVEHILLAPQSMLSPVTNCDPLLKSCEAFFSFVDVNFFTCGKLSLGLTTFF